MPFNDPHTAAPNLWVWRHEGVGRYECSVAELDCDGQLRQVAEDYLLWIARVEAGCSTLCNHGKFHPGYVKSLSRKSGRRGGRISSASVSPGALNASDALPLEFSPDPLDSDWMTLRWSDPEPLLPGRATGLKNRNGVYRIIEGDGVIYIGESSRLKDRMAMHAKVLPGELGDGLLYSCVYLPDAYTSVHRHEIEVDLIGGFYHQYRRAPLRQYRPAGLLRL